MKKQVIYSANAAFQKLEVLKTNRNKRYKYNEFFVEGVRNINEAVKRGWHINSFIYGTEAGLSDWARGVIGSTPTRMNYELSDELMRRLSGKEDTSELMAAVQMREDSLDKLVLPANPAIALFDRPSNKGNLGTIIRSCDSFGMDALLLTGHAVDLYDPEVITASMGSFFKVPVIRVEDNNALYAFFRRMKERCEGFNIVGTTAHRQTEISQVDFTVPTLIMIGNETMGLNAAFKEKCDILATIPMSESSSASSLNVGCAATVFMYEICRQRRQAGLI
ncbi:MAG: TrmH family RNA methyltransferase [Firmicutes bacterium]|nr:TrmH family RNA methyltransferase [Bacillota bacterium]